MDLAIVRDLARVALLAQDGMGFLFLFLKFIKLAMARAVDGEDIMEEETVIINKSKIS